MKNWNKIAYTKIKTKILTEKNYVNKMDYEMVVPMLTPCVGNKPEETVSENTAKKTEDSIEKAPSQHFPNSSSKSLQVSIKEMLYILMNTSIQARYQIDSRVVNT